MGVHTSYRSQEGRFDGSLFKNPAQGCSVMQLEDSAISSRRAPGPVTPFLPAAACVLLLEQL